MPEDIGAATGEIEWRSSVAPVPYDDAVAAMEARVAAIRDGHAPELVWLLEHPPLYTAGTSARAEDLLEPDRLPVYRSGRGGQYTYHGPGQRIAYAMLDLDRPAPGRGRDVRCHVWRLEEWMIRVLARFGVEGERRDGRIGVWSAGPGGREDKIAAIGVRVRRWVSFHGAALNVDPDLDQFRGIVPCGIAPELSGHGVTSLARLGIRVTMAEVDRALRDTFDEAFAAATAAPPLCPAEPK
ncbi:MAG TPA: lipoyl(octanoyl) transferase LipB [Stellaceae bacterium]|jgi:lipoyl(octanoyl) transferase|nr:lipoyl(octanoyl) transferase LipB [Stellaceae bacterium]